MHIVLLARLDGYTAGASSRFSNCRASHFFVNDTSTLRSIRRWQGLLWKDGN
jgi:hypothetical protein